MSLSHADSDPMDPDLQNALCSVAQDIERLVRRIADEQQAWITHLVQARADDIHKLHGDTRFRTADEMMQQLQAVYDQVQSFNYRASASHERGTNLPELEWTDVVPSDETLVLSTETASTMLRRAIISARLELTLQLAALTKVENAISLAFRVLARMADNISRNLHSRIHSPDSCRWCLWDDSTYMVNMLKSVMARLGMPLARQRMMDEYFDPPIAVGDVFDDTGDFVNDPLSLPLDSILEESAGVGHHGCRKDDDEDDESEYGPGITCVQASILDYFHPLAAEYGPAPSSAA